MALKVEVIVDSGMHAEEALGGSSRFEPLHLALSSSHHLGDAILLRKHRTRRAGRGADGAVNQSASDYLRRKVWEPIGAEADAPWLVDAQGFEVAHFGFNAVLRDYARLGRLLAHDGAWDGKQIIPARWMIDATTVKPADSYLAAGNAMPYFGYGYLLWLLPGPRRQFAFSGNNGQRVCIDPASKLVMVQTALEDTPKVWRLWSALVKQFGQE